jgi:prepilin-type N-terminal cleavage/methylation domain-containing protein
MNARCGQTDPPPARRPPLSGFTLIEVLVVSGVIAVLMAILLPVLSAARQCAVVTGELSAARQFIAAHAMYSSEFAGRVMPGFPSQTMVQRGEVTARNDLGERILEPWSVAARYPWRLMPYLENSRDIYFFDSRADVEETFGGTLSDYAISLVPRFGLNQAFIGGSGDSDATGIAFHARPATRERAVRAWGPHWYVSRAADAPRPADLLVFASAASTHPFASGVRRMEGFYRVTPPNFTNRLWQRDDPDATTPLTATGNVAFRFARKTVGAMMDGHAQSLSWEQMNDMRRWSPRADAPDHRLPPP